MLVKRWSVSSAFRSVWLRSIAGAIAMCLCGLVIVGGSSASASGTERGPRTKAVDYRGFVFRVPTAWSVLPNEGCPVKGPAIVVGGQPDFISCNGLVTQTATVAVIVAVAANGFVESVATARKSFAHGGVAGTFILGLASNPGGPNVQPPLTPTSPWALDAHFNGSHVQFGARGFGGPNSRSARQALRILLSVTRSVHKS
jgi:hypothetical protein